MAVPRREPKRFAKFLVVKLLRRTISMLHATDAPGYSINIWLYKFLSLNQIKRSVATLYHLAMKNLHLVKVHGIFCNFESGSTLVIVHIE